MASSRLCAAALTVTAIIHLAVVPEHAREWPAAAAFFVVLAVVEVALAVAVMTKNDRGPLLAGSMISGMSAVLWAASRTVGLPIGPDPFSPEAVAASDLIATALEVVAAATFFRLAIRPGAVSTSAHAHR